MTDYIMHVGSLFSALACDNESPDLHRRCWSNFLTSISEQTERSGDFERMRLGRKISENIQSYFDEHNIVRVSHRLENGPTIASLHFKTQEDMLAFILEWS